MARSWKQLPLDRVVRLAGAPGSAIVAAVDPLPDDAPAVVIYRPNPVPTPLAAITRLVDELEAVASNLYPAWLPGAQDIEGAARADLAAVRALARRHSAGTNDFGPYLADLAERCQRDRIQLTPRQLDREGHDLGRRAPSAAGKSPFAAEMRAVGLARVVAAAYRRGCTALLVDVPPEFPEPAGRSLLVACEWFAHHSRAGVWLTGAQLPGGDRLSVGVVPAVLDAEHGGRDGSHRDLDRSDDKAPEGADTPDGQGADELPPTMTLPAPAGRPHPASRAELALERALAVRPWAAGRRWNQTYSYDLLSQSVRLDLLWPAEHCVVEVDGPEHWNKANYTKDRHRDVRLQLDGYAVLRFTNDQVFDDVDAVAARIERFIIARRHSRQEGHHHV